MGMKDRACLILLSILLNSAWTEEIKNTGVESSNARHDVDNTDTFRHSRSYRGDFGNWRGDDSGYQDDHVDDQEGHDDEDEDDHGNTKAIVEPKLDYWGGYYDFLINEGSYKFWAVFQLATAALLIYSGFAALYYAKVNPSTTEDEFDDIFRRRRKRRALPPAARDRTYAGLDSVTFQRIMEAIARGFR